MDARYPRRWTVGLCGWLLLAGTGLLTANGAAWADSGPAEQTQLEEVVVTAEFREEKLQNTPIAITAITAAGLEERGLSNITEVGAFVPNAVIQPLGAGWGAALTIALILGAATAAS